MREKTMKLVITFHTTTQAIAMEAFCQKEELPGRLIPLPGVVSVAYVGVLHRKKKKS